MSSPQQAIPLTPVTPRGSTSSRIPQTSIQLASGSQAPGGQQSQSRPNRSTPSPAQQSSQTLRPPTFGVPPVSSPTQRPQTIFRFRSERANWIAVIAIVITLILGTIAAVYSAIGVRLAEDSKRLAVWEAEKDYQIYCQNVKAAHQRLSDECARIVDAVLSPPPFHDPSIFVRLLTGIRRSIARLPSARALRSSMIFALLFNVACGMVLVLVFVLYDTPKAPRRRQILENRTAIISPFLLRVPLLCYVGLPSVKASGIPDPVQAVFLLLWVAGHLWGFYRTMIMSASQVHSTSRQIQMSMCTWSMYGAFTSILMAFDQPWFLTLLTILDISVSALYISSEFGGYKWACTAIGPSWGVRFWALGHYLNAILGMVFFSHLTLGGDIGEPLIAMGKVMQPSLHFRRKLLAACWLLFFIAFFADLSTHYRRHRRSGTGCSS